MGSIDQTAQKRMPPSWTSKTLRLPRSPFPPRSNPTDRPKYIRQVTDELYAWQKTHGTGRFILHDGPPYANGDLHIGHALNKVLKDIICRYQVSLGKRVDFRPGWDCHGLPIELKALQKQKEIGKLEDGHHLGPKEIRQVARELATETVKLQMARFREWAVMADWENPWRTMDKDYEIRQLEIFKLMVENGQIYRQLKPVYWSPSTRTALAEAELEYNSDHRSTAAYVKFPLHKLSQAVLDVVPQHQETISAVIWTTTPWTLPANRAIAIKRDMEYLVLQHEDHGVILVASSRMAEFENFCAGATVLGKISGADLEGSTYFPPFGSRESAPQPILHAQYVTDESGTGLVHMAPGHGMDDYKLCLKHGIQPFAPLDDAGLFTADAYPGSNELIGKDVLGAGNRRVLELLEQDKLLVATHKYRHKYPYDWRSKKPVVIRATRQWFADLSGIRSKALQSLDSVKFLPSSGHDRLSSFIKGRSEWCISRQRSWGVPIPAIYAEDGEPVMTTESIAHIISIINQRGIDSWWSDDPTDPAWVLPSIRSRGSFSRGTDTMDVWFDSGTSWSEMQSETSSVPHIADVILEGTDQHRGWFQSSLLTKVAQLQAANHETTHAPFKTLITHGFTLDHRGKKMSKSEGNVISPQQIMDGTLLPPLKRKSLKTDKNKGPMYDGMGPDALRLWVASSDFTHDIAVGEALLRSINGSLAKLRVTFKLLTGLLDTYNPESDTELNQLQVLDRLAMFQSQKMRMLVDAAYQEHTFHRVVSVINNYVNTDLSAFYIESIKDRCYVDAIYSKSRVNAQRVLWLIYRNLSHVLAPITPLLVAEAREYLPKQLQFYDAFRTMTSEASLETNDAGLEHIFEHGNPFNIRKIWDQIKKLQEDARTEKLMGSSLDCNVAIRLPRETVNVGVRNFVSAMEGMQSELEDLFVVSKVSFLSTDEDLVKIKQAKWLKHHELLEKTDDDTTVSLGIYVHAPEHAKCIRCWKYTVEQEHTCEKQDNADFPGASTALEDPVCQRCLGVLQGQLEDEPALFEGRPNIAKAAAECSKLHDTEYYRWNWDFKQATKDENR